MRKVLNIFLSTAFLFILLFSIKAYIAEKNSSDHNSTTQISYFTDKSEGIMPGKIIQTALVCLNLVSQEIQKEKSIYFPGPKISSNHQGALNIYLYDRIKPLQLRRNIHPDKGSNSIPGSFFN